MTQKSPTILVVDDSKAVNSILSESIREQLHFNVVSAFTMAEARHAIAEAKEPFLVAILDLNLPDAPDGEVVQMVLDVGTRCIILTANMSDELHDEMLELPVVDYVVKRNLGEMQYVIDQIRRLYDNAKRTVLVVDDSKISRQLLRSLLERHNLNVVEASDGVEGLNELQLLHSVDLIIVDYNMPNMDGIEFISKVRNQYSRTDLSIIGMSSMGSGSVSVKMLKSGANDFIKRPFMIEEFYCRMNQNIDVISGYKKLQKQTFHDFLTNLYNRRYLFETGHRLFENAKRQNLPLAVAMVDIDFFKKVNDTHGHKAGDLVLQHVANLLQNHFRDSDLIARVGGEEFCILSTCIDFDATHRLFDGLRLKVQDSPCTYGQHVINITISIGFTHNLSSTFEAMVGAADKCLYQAKVAGRNQVVADTEANRLRSPRSEGTDDRNSRKERLSRTASAENSAEGE